MRTKKYPFAIVKSLNEERKNDMYHSLFLGIMVTLNVMFFLYLIGSINNFKLIPFMINVCVLIVITYLNHNAIRNFIYRLNCYQWIDERK